METAPERMSLLAEMEAMQDDLIARLDELDQRVCRTIKEWNSRRQDSSSTLSPPELN